MEEIEPYSALLRHDLFSDFEFQLRKDFEGAGMAIDADVKLPSRYDDLKNFIMRVIFETGKQHISQLPQLLYRIDVSELQIKKYSLQFPSASFESLVAELIIKRELQKIILRKRFSS